MGLVISPRVRDKLALKHRVSEEDIEQCFANLNGRFLLDTREEHRSDPPTRWFVAETDFGRVLKIVFVPTGNGIEIKTAYEANSVERKIYDDHGR
jgi:hypothetical protein